MSNYLYEECIGDGMAVGNRDLPLQVQTILAGNIGQRADFNDEDYLRMQCPDEIDFEAYLEGLRKIEESIDSEERIRELFLSYPSIYRTAFIRYLELTPNEWQIEFGDPPTGLDSWEALQASYAFDLIVDADERESAIPSNLKHYVEGTAGTWVLAVQCDYASELSAIGYLSRNQAVAFVLNTFGYSTARIAEITDKPDGTASSHLSRGKSAVRRMETAVEFVENIRNQRPPLMKTYAELIGEVFMNNARGEYARVVNLYREEEATEAFLLGIQSGEGREYTSDPDEFLNDWQRAPQVDVEFPELQELHLGDKEKYLDNPFY